jgi:hypothetical protein
MDSGNTALSPLAAARAALSVAKDDLHRINSTRSQTIAARQADVDAAQADLVLYEEACNRQALLVRTGVTPQARVGEPTRNLKATLERLVDFDLFNGGAMRFTVGAVNVKSSNCVYFAPRQCDGKSSRIIASGCLPATEINGEYYWDGGRAANDTGIIRSS